MEENKIAVMKLGAGVLAARVAVCESQKLAVTSLLTVDARQAVDYVAYLEQTSRAQRTTEEAFVPLNEGDFMAIWNELGGDDKWLKNFGYYQFGFAVQDAICNRLAAPVAATEQATDDEAEYELVQDDMLVASTSGPDAYKEILHYAAQYEQDGPVEIIKVVRTKLSGAPLATPADAGAGPIPKTGNEQVDSFLTDYEIRADEGAYALTAHDRWVVANFLIELDEELPFLARLSTPGAPVAASDEEDFAAIGAGASAFAAVLQGRRGQSPAPVTAEPEYLALRLKRVARAAGVPIFDKWSDAQVAECAVTILGEIARKLEAPAPADRDALPANTGERDATPSPAKVDLSGLTRYKLMSGDTREWMTAAHDGHWYKVEDVQALIGTSTSSEDAGGAA